MINKQTKSSKRYLAKLNKDLEREEVNTENLLQGKIERM